jgi:hypothetical protein
MHIDRDVILDLVPLYLSGDASHASRQLVERYAREHPDIAEALETPDLVALVPPGEQTLPKEMEMRALERTKSLLRLRSILLGTAIFLSLLPFSVRGGAAGVRWFWSGAEAYAVSVGVLAVIAWFAYALLQRRLHPHGW